MESLERIRSYINSMNIRKTMIGGYDHEDVSIKMNGLIDVFREYVKEEVEEYKKNLTDLQSTVAELQKKIDALTTEKSEAEKEMEEMKGIYKKCCSDILEQYSGSLQTLSAEFSKMLENVSMLQQNIVKLGSVEKIEMPADAIEEEEIFKLPDWGINFDELL